MRLYIAGPMRGLPDYGFPSFDGVRDALLAEGHEPISPADHDREIGYVDESSGSVVTTDAFDIDVVMRWDLAQVAQSDGIVLLPGWEDSRGAAHERYVAQACGLSIYHAKQNDNGTWSVGNLERPATIIGLSGYAQSGKDTAGAALVEHLGFERVGFADALKNVLYNLNPTVEVLDGIIRVADHPWCLPVQAVVDGYGWEWAKANSSVRELLQRLGTEAGRHVLGDDVWVRTAMAKVKPGGRYVFTDVRFPNEAQAIKDLGGEVWRIDRRGSNPVNAHASETELDGWAFDRRIHNQGVDLTGYQQLVVSLGLRLVDYSVSQTD